MAACQVSVPEYHLVVDDKVNKKDYIPGIISPGSFDLGDKLIILVIEGANYYVQIRKDTLLRCFSHTGYISLGC
ncbi:hypothetical protein ACFL2N_02025 [Pseudomonadota bacterium]